ncbi:MAG: cytochrome c biogenesis protein ResB, partial [Thermodesulfobacteriota bacterium]
MSNDIQSVNLSDRIWNFFASVKLSVILLLTLALTSIIGTLIPQHKQASQYL